MKFLPDFGDGDIMGIVAGTGLSGSSLSGPIPTLNVDTEIPEITTLAGLTRIGAAGATTNILAGDLAMYNPVNDGNPTFSIGSSASDRLEIKSLYNSGAQTLCDVEFTTYTASGTTNDGRFGFFVDEVQLANLHDTSLTIYGTNGIISLADGASLKAFDSSTSSTTEGGTLILQSDDGSAMGDNHRLGVIEF